MRRFAPLVFCLVAACLFSAAAAGDVIRTKDGREFVGLIVKETATSVTIDTIVSNIRSPVTLRRSEIREIERGPVADDFFEPKKPGGAVPSPSVKPAERDRPARPASRQPTGARAGETMFLEIPIEGTFGEDIIPIGVANALDGAKRRGVREIVFRINSNGGFVWAAEDIAKILDERAADFTYHAVIEKAISASIWVALSCETMHMAPGSTIGAAVVFSVDESTGEAEVDAKMNSAIAGGLAARAEKNGHNPDVVRAMVLGASELWEWVDESGEVRVGAAVPKGVRASDSKKIDDAKSVLTLTAEDAVRLGFARPIETASGVALAAALGAEGWRSGGTTGRTEMERAKAKAGTLFDKFRRLNSGLGASIDAAQSADPYSYNDYFVDYGGNLTDSSRRNWQSRTDEAINAWNRVRATLVEMERLERDREALAMSRWVDTVDLKDLFQRVGTEINRLQRERDRR